MTSRRGRWGGNWVVKGSEFVLGRSAGTSGCASCGIWCHHLKWTLVAAWIGELVVLKSCGVVRCGELTWQVWEWLNAACSQLWVLRRGPCLRVLFLANPGFVLTWLSLSVLLRIKNYAWIKMRVQMVLSGPLCKRDYNNVLKSLWSGFKIEEGELHRWSAMVTFHLPEYRWNKGMLVKVIWIALEPYSMIWFKDHKRRILLEARPQKRTGDEELSCSQLWDGRAAAAGPGPPGPPIPVGGRKHGGQWEGRTLGPCSAPVFDEEENLLEQERREGAEAFPRCQ